MKECLCSEEEEEVVVVEEEEEEEEEVVEEEDCSVIRSLFICPDVLLCALSCISHRI